MLHHSSITAPKFAHSKTFWFCLSLTCALVLGLGGVKIAFSNEWMVQDDVRQHVFWMRRFLDPDLFQQDLIADYFQSVAPLGYSAVYRALAALGLDPLVSSKLLIVPLLLITTTYCFGVCLEILPVPIAGFLSTLLLNQNLIMADDLNSATPRAFIYPLFLAFLYYFLRRSFLCWGAIGLLGLFYPQMMFVAVGVVLLSLLKWEGRRPQLAASRRDLWLAGVGVGVAAIVLIIYIFSNRSDFAPVISAAQAKLMPEFWAKGRGSFFTHNPFDFWLLGPRSGLLPRLGYVLKPPLLLAGLLLPWLLRSRHFPLSQQVTDRAWVFGQIGLASIGCFLAAHVLLFRLHHPSRYTQHSLKIVLALTAGIALTILLDGLWRWSAQRARQWAAIATTGLLSLFLLIYPALIQFQTNSPLLEWLLPLRIYPGYVIGRVPDLYDFFAQQPKASLIASLISEADNLPTFAQRSILVGREYGIPYHLGYYQQFRQRAIDLIQAQYSPSLAEVQRFTDKYGIDFWLLNDKVFTPEFVLGKDWLRQYQPTAQAAATALKRGQRSIVQQSIERCMVFRADEMLVLDAACVVGRS